MGGFFIKSRSCRHIQLSQKWFKNGLNWFKFKALQPRKPLSRKALLVQTLHGGEEQYVADRLAVGQQHGHAVDAEADAARDGPCGSIRGPNLLCRKGFHVPARALVLC